MTNWRLATEADQSLENSPEYYFAPSDSAGFYWASLQMAKYSDKEHQIKRVVINTINQQDTKIYYRSHAFWEASAAVNLPDSIESHYSSSLNGFESRCCAYAYAWVILTEGKLPNTQGELTTDFPEGYKKRAL